MSQHEVLALLDAWRAAERALDELSSDAAAHREAAARVDAARAAYKRAFDTIVARSAHHWEEAPGDASGSEFVT